VGPDDREADRHPDRPHLRTDGRRIQSGRDAARHGERGPHRARLCASHRGASGCRAFPTHQDMDAGGVPHVSPRRTLPGQPLDAPQIPVGRNPRVAGPSRAFLYFLIAHRKAPAITRRCADRAHYVKGRRTRPGRSSNPEGSAETTVRLCVRAVAAITRSLTPRGRPERRVCARSDA
jgi:hypothetical protein